MIFLKLFNLLSRYVERGTKRADQESEQGHQFDLNLAHKNFEFTVWVYIQKLQYDKYFYIHKHPVTSKFTT